MEALKPSKLAWFRTGWAIPSAVVLLGIALRLYRLDQQSLWYDEIFSLAVSRLPFPGMTANLVEDIVHPPLHYYLLHVWFRLFGFNPFQARLLSVVWGTLAILMIYILGKHLFDRRTGLLSALLLCISQIGVMYSQEARPYAQVFFLILCSSYLFILAIRTKRRLPWWGFVISATLTIYTHYYGFFVVVALLFFAVLFRKRYRLRSSQWIGGLAVGLLLYSPWLASGVVGQALHTSKIKFGQNADPPSVYWWTLLSVANTFDNGRPAGLLESSPWWTFPVGGLLFGVPLLLALRPLIKGFKPQHADQLEQENVVLSALVSALPVSLALTVGALHGPYSMRYVSFCAAPYYLLVARGLSTMKPALLRSVVLILGLAYSVYSLKANYFIPYKENYRDALADLARLYKEGDCSVVAPPWEERQVRWAWSIYHGDQPELKIANLEAVTSGQTNCGRVWLISVAYRGFPAAVRNSREMRESLEHVRSKTEEKRYFWVDLGLYEQKKQHARLHNSS